MVRNEMVKRNVVKTYTVTKEITHAPRRPCENNSRKGKEISPQRAFVSASLPFVLINRTRAVFFRPSRAIEEKSTPRRRALIFIRRVGASNAPRAATSPKD